MIKMVGLSKKMKERIERLEQMSREGKDMVEIMNILTSEGWHKDMMYRTIASWKKGVVVVHSKPILRKGKSVILGEDSKCYFCFKESVMKHHISYTPEKLIHLCEKCHSKLHNVIKEYHNKEIEYSSNIKNVQKSINRIKDEIELIKIFE